MGGPGGGTGPGAFHGQVGLPSRSSLLFTVKSACRVGPEQSVTAGSARPAATDRGRAPCTRQWPEVYENCTRLACNSRMSVCLACNSRMSVCFLTRATCKNVRQNLIPRATAYRARSAPRARRARGPGPSPVCLCLCLSLSPSSSFSLLPLSPNSLLLSPSLYPPLSVFLCKRGPGRAPARGRASPPPGPATMAVATQGLHGPALVRRRTRAGRGRPRVWGQLGHGARGLGVPPPTPVAVESGPAPVATRQATGRRSQLEGG